MAHVRITFLVLLIAGLAAPRAPAQGVEPTRITLHPSAPAGPGAP